MEQDDVHTKYILGADLSILGTVSTYFTEQEDPTKDLRDLSPNPKHPNSHLGGGGSGLFSLNEEEENVYSADISEFSDTDQSESKSTRSSCAPQQQQQQCERCSLHINPPPPPPHLSLPHSSANNNIATSRGIPNNNSGSNNNGLLCSCSVGLPSHRPALRTKNVSSNGFSENTSSTANTAINSKTGNPIFHSSHLECMSPKSPRSPKSSGLSDVGSRVSLLYNQSQAQSNAGGLGLNSGGLAVLANTTNNSNSNNQNQVIDSNKSGEATTAASTLPLSDSSIMSPPPPVIQVRR